MEAVSPSEKLVIFYHNTRRHIPEESRLLLRVTAVSTPKQQIQGRTNGLLSFRDILSV
jgi:hypothetical protein